jgi:parallel beta-helix repeat protein
MPNYRLFAALACAAVFSTPLVSWSAEYWVAPPPSGNDSNVGSELAPWATLQHAASQVGPGDSVWVQSGSYAGMQVTTSGSPGQPITFRAAPGESPQIVVDNPSTPDGINVEGGDWIVIDGFTVNNRTRAGIRAVLCEHVTIRNNSCDSNGTWGIFTGFCDDLLIEDNVTSRSGDEHGIYVSNSGDRPVIRGNRIWGNHANGIHMNGDASMGGDGIISGALVEANIIWDNGTGGGSGINMDGVQDSLVRNNLVFDSHASGISLYRIDGAAGSSNNRVLNNTVLVSADGRWALNIQNGSTGNEVRNNIFWSDHGYRGAMSVCSACLPGFTSDHNAVEDRFTLDDGDSTLTLGEWRSATGQDTDSLLASPSELFESPAGDDYHLSAESPAGDAGELRADVPRDLDGVTRPIGATHDIGAYEGGGLVFADGFESGDASRWTQAAW